MTDGEIVTINTPGTWTGTTQNSFGTLNMGAANVLPPTTTVNIGQANSNATLDLKGFSQTIGGFGAYVRSSTSYTCNITSSSGTPTLTVNTAVANTDYIPLAGSLSLSVTGGGTVTLSPMPAVRTRTAAAPPCPPARWPWARPTCCPRPPR